MCLSIPGKLIEETGEGLKRTGKIDFGGVIKEISLGCVPEAKISDYVLVHAGFGLSVIDEEEANKTLEYLKNLDDDEMEVLRKAAL